VLLVPTLAPSGSEFSVCPTRLTSTSATLARCGIAHDTLQQWFDGNDRQVQQAIADVDQLQQAELASALPDISGPWRTLDGLRQSPARLPAAARNPELTPVPVHGDAEGVVPALPVDDAEGAVAEPTVDDAG
jgi:hypothetical protein